MRISLRGRRWGAAVPLLPLVLATMSSQTLVFVLTPTIVDVGRSFDASVSAVGQARSIAALAGIGFTVLVPMLLRRRGLGGLIATGVGFAIAGTTAAAAAPSLPAYLLAHLLVGAGLGALLSAGFAGVAAFPAGQRARAMAYVAAANALAWIVANPVIGVLTDAVSWRLAQLVPAVVALATLASIPWARPIAEAPLERGWLRTFASVRGAWRWAGAEMLAYCAWAGAFLTFIGAYFIQRHGISEAFTGVLLAAAGSAYLIASLRSAPLTARFPREPLLRVAALSMLPLFLLLFALESRLAIDLAIFCAIAMLAGLRAPASAGLGMAQMSGHPGAMMAARTGSVQLGYLIGAAAGGAVLAVADYELLGVLLAAFMAGSAWAMSGVPDPDFAGRPAPR